MATFPSYRHTAADVDLYVTLNNAAGQYWDTTSTPKYETLVVADWANYDVEATETPASSYQYIADVPGTLTSGALVYVTYYLRAGGTPAITDTVLDRQVYMWDGTSITPGVGQYSAAAAGYSVAELLTKISGILNWSTTDAASYTKIYQAITECGRAASTWEGETWSWQHERGQFTPLSLTLETVANDGADRASNIVTITTTAAHGLSVGRYIRISGCDDSTMDGTFVIASVPSTTTFTYVSAGDNSDSGVGYVYSNEYALRTVNGSIMADLYSVERVYFDDERVLTPTSYRRIRGLDSISHSLTENEPTEYGLKTTSDGPVIYLNPTPNTTDVLHIDYIPIHNKVAAGADSYLIIPPEFQEGIYVAGSLFLLRTDIGDIASLRECPGFMEAIDRMSTSDLMGYDDDQSNKYGDTDGFPGGHWPQNQRVTGGVVQNWGSV